MRRENPRYHSICNPYRNTTQILNAEKTEDPTAVSDLRLKSHRCLELRCRLSPAADSLKKLCPDPLYHSRCKNNNTKFKKSQGLKNRRRFFSLLSCIYSLSQLRCRRLTAARSRRGSDSPPDCHSLPRRHSATPEEEPSLCTDTKTRGRQHSRPYKIQFYRKQSDKLRSNLTSVIFLCKP